MEKRGKIIFLSRQFVLILLLVINLSLVLVCAQEGENKFDSEDIRTWEYGTYGELRALTSEDLYLHYKGYPEVIEDLWEKFSEKSKNDFLETESYRKTKSKVVFENLGHKDLRLKDGVLTSPNGAIFDMNNFPDDLKKISYDSEKGFIYEYGNGKKITIDNGGVDKEGKVFGTKDGKNDRMQHLAGEIVITGKRINLIDESSEIIVSERTFSFGQSKNEPSFVIISAEGIYGVNNVKVTSSEANFNIPAKNTYLIFQKGDYSGTAGISEQYFQLFDNILIGAGEGSVNLLKSFEEIHIKGSGEGITVYNGETNDFPIEFIGDKTNIPRLIKDAPFDMESINNVLDEKKYYSLKTDENGARYFSDNQKTSIVGKAYVSYFGIEQIKENSLLKIPGPATAVSASFELGVIDQKNIPEGLDREGYLEYLSESEHKSAEFRLNKITDYMISRGIAKTARDIAGQKFLDNLRAISDKAAEYGFIETRDQTQFDKELDEAVAKGALEVLKMADSAIKNRPLASFREINSDMPAVEFVDTILGSEVIQENIPGAETVSDTIANAKGVVFGVQTYIDLSDALQKVYDTYGIIPKDTSVRIVRAGNDAYGVVDSPAIKLRKGDEFVDVRMEPIKFSINPDTANIIMNGVSKSSDRLSGWNRYQKGQK